MAGKIIDASFLSTAINSTAYKNNIVISWRGRDIELRRYISFEESLIFISDIINECTDEINGAINFGAVDFLIKAHIISLFTNIQLPADVEDLNRVIYGTDLYNIVIDNISREQVESLCKSVYFYLNN